jgi:hypothetical protein
MEWATPEIPLGAGTKPNPTCIDNAWGLASSKSEGVLANAEIIMPACEGSRVDYTQRWAW